MINPFEVFIGKESSQKWIHPWLGKWVARFYMSNWV